MKNETENFKSAVDFCLGYILISHFNMHFSTSSTFALFWGPKLQCQLPDIISARPMTRLWSGLAAQGRGGPWSQTDPLGTLGGLQMGWVSGDTALPTPSGHVGACAEFAVCGLLRTGTFEKLFAHFNVLNPAISMKGEWEFLLRNFIHV